MADVHEPAIRSYNMSRIKGKDTKPELLVRRFLHQKGFRFTLHGKFRGNKLPGKPDLVLPKYKTVIFIHGCFWHAHRGCKYFKIPETRTEFWKEKLTGNANRDQLNQKALRELGWKVMVIWTCEIKKKDEFISKLTRLSKDLQTV